MKTEKCYVNAKYMTTIVCPTCNERKRISVADYRNKQHRIKVRCQCNEIFSIQLDFRSHYRKKINLAGKFIKLDSLSGREYYVIITNLSSTGLAFLISGTHNLKKGDKLSIEFQLNDKKKSEIVKKVEVFNVKNNLIGCHFIDNESVDKALGFYLHV